MDKSALSNKPFFNNPLKFEESKNNDISQNFPYIFDENIQEKLIVFDKSLTHQIENQQNDNNHQTNNTDINQNFNEQLSRTPPNNQISKNNEFMTEETLNKTNYMFDKKIDSEKKIQYYKGKPLFKQDVEMSNDDKEIDAYILSQGQYLEHMKTDQKINEKK